MNNHISVRVEGDSALFAALTERDNLEALVIYESGKVLLYNLTKEAWRFVGKLPFDLDDSELKIYCFGDYCSVVKNRGLQGVVLNLENEDFLFHFTRANYFSDHCEFPVGFYGKGGQTFLIHATEWNRLDITNLETGRILTVRTSSNDFDYFHSDILVSPNYKWFAVKGWVWGPMDLITVYRIEEFLEKYESSSIPIDFESKGGYNWERPVCWVDENKLAIGHNRGEENEDGIEPFASEILLFDVRTKELIKRFDFDGFSVEDYNEVKGKLYFDPEGKRFIALSNQETLYIADIKGNEICRSPSMRSDQYSVKHNLLLNIDTAEQKLSFRSLSR